MSVLKFETFEAMREDTAVRDVLESDGRVWVEVVGISFMVEDMGSSVKVYKYGKDSWVYAGKYVKPADIL